MKTYREIEIHTSRILTLDIRWKRVFSFTQHSFYPFLGNVSCYPLNKMLFVPQIRLKINNVWGTASNRTPITRNTVTVVRYPGSSLMRFANLIVMLEERHERRGRTVGMLASRSEMPRVRFSGLAASCDYKYFRCMPQSQDNIVGIATGYGLGNRGFGV
jgi:hypothetical protein